MPIRHQKFDAVIFWRDRIIGGDLDDLDIFHRQLVSARRARFGARHACENDGRFLRQFFRRVERFRRNVFLENDGLNKASSVAEFQELQFALVGLVREPALERDRFTDVLRNALDVNVVCHANSISDLGFMIADFSRWYRSVEMFEGLLNRAFRFGVASRLR